MTDKSHMSNLPKPGAVVFAKDIRKVARFYEQLIPLSVTHTESSHIVLESDVMQLVIHGIPKKIADSIHVATPPAVREETPIKLFFPVASLVDARIRAEQLGGQLGPSKKEWEARGFRACDGYDPEGNVFQLRQTVL